VTDPFTGQNPSAAGRMAAPQPGADQGPVRLPPVESADASAGNQLLLMARQALALGDARGPPCSRSRRRPFPSSAGRPTTPRERRALIRKHQDLTALPAERKNSESYRREYARLLMDQAEGLFRRGDLGESERLAQLAARQQATFGGLETKPEQLLARIAAARRQGGPAGMPGNGPAAGAAPGGPSGVIPAGAQFAVPHRRSGL